MDLFYIFVEQLFLFSGEGGSVRAPMVLRGSGGEIYTVFDEESESEVQNLLKPQEI